MKYLIFFFGFFVLTHFSNADDKICFSSEVGFRMKQIKGWDNSLILSGYCGIQVIKGFNFNTSAALIYPRLSKLTSLENSKKYITEDLRNLTKNSPKLKIKDLPNYKSKNGLEFKIKELRGQESPMSYEIFAYNLQKSTLLNVVFSSDKEDVFKKHRSSFFSFLDQIDLVSSDDLKKIAPIQYKKIIEIENETETEKELKQEKSKN